VKALFDAGADDQLRSELMRLLQRPWSAILTDWRTHVLRFGRSDGESESATLGLLVPPVA
jgi:hypothetical protein